MPFSAYYTFKNGPLQSSRNLLALEAQLSSQFNTDPDTLKGLRGGAHLILVGGFEFYINEMISSASGCLHEGLPIPPMRSSKLNDKIKISLIKSTSKYLLKLSLDKQRSQSDKISASLRTSDILSKGFIDPEWIKLDRPNPTPKNINNLFSSIGLNNVLDQRRLKNQYEVISHTRIMDKFISTKLDEIVQKRHKAAHSGRLDNTSNYDIVEYCNFIDYLSQSLEIITLRHFSTLLSYCL